jgi:hypothetical protein
MGSNTAYVNLEVKKLPPLVRQPGEVISIKFDLVGGEEVLCLFNITIILPEHERMMTIYGL